MPDKGAQECIRIITWEELRESKGPGYDAWHPKGPRQCYHCQKPIEGTKGTVFALADSTDPENPDLPRWRLWCDDCYFRPDSEGHSMRDRNPYWIGLDQFQNWQQYGEATIHVGGKSWHDPYSWALIGTALFQGRTAI